MSGDKEKCEHPEKLKDGDPSKCSPEQVKQCHGDEKKHSCAKKD
jgi:hypothetical protein